MLLSWISLGQRTKTQCLNYRKSARLTTLVQCHEWTVGQHAALHSNPTLVCSAWHEPIALPRRGQCLQNIESNMNNCSATHSHGNNETCQVASTSVDQQCVKRLYIYKQAGQCGSSMNNLIQIPKNRWDFPSILCANARSVTKKIDELDAECQNKCIYIAAITETWLKDDIPSISLQLCDLYPPLRNDRSSRRGGGCGVLRSTGHTIQTLGGAAGALC